MKMQRGQKKTAKFALTGHATTWTFIQDEEELNNARRLSENGYVDFDSRANFGKWEVFALFRHFRHVLRRWCLGGPTLSKLRIYRKVSVMKVVLFSW